MNDKLRKDRANYLTDYDSSEFIKEQHRNVQTDLITITEVKLHNILLLHLKKIGLINSWLVPLGLFLTFLAALLTATFQKKFGIEAEFWHSLFMIGGIATAIWFFYSLYNLFTNRKDSTIDSLISKIKNQDTKI